MTKHLLYFQGGEELIFYLPSPFQSSVPGLSVYCFSRMITVYSGLICVQSELMLCVCVCEREYTCVCMCASASVPTTLTSSFTLVVRRSAV